MKTNISLVQGFLASFFVVSLNLFADNTATENSSALTQNVTLTERFSDKVIFRPGIMPVGIINFDNDVTIKSKKPENGSLTRSTNLTISSQFGIIQRLQGEISYEGGFPFKPTKEDAASNVVTFGTKYNYLSLPHAAFSASAKLPMHILSGDEIVKDVTLGLPVVFYNDVMAGSILGDVMTIGMRPKVSLGFDFPFWYGVQVYGNLWTMVNSSFGSVKMVNKDNQATWENTPFWKKLPASLALTYVINHYFDVGASFGFDDTIKASETMKFGLNFSLRGGRIFG